MILELLVVLTFLGGGTLLIRTTGLTGWPLPFVGYIAGVCLHIALGFALVALGLPTTPLLVLPLTLALPAIAWTVALSRGREVGIPTNLTLFVALVVAFAVVMLRGANLVAYHWDSFRYLTVGSLLERGELERAGLFLLETRLLAVPLLHAPAQIQGELYLRSVTPLLGVATLGLVAWLLRTSLRPKLGDSGSLWFVVVGVGTLVSINRFVFHSFYLNGHLIVATLLFAVAAAPWVRSLAGDHLARPLLAMQLLAMPVLVVTRPETTLLAGLAILPFLLADRFPFGERAAVAMALGSSIIAWNGFYVREHEGLDQVSGEVWFLLALGLLCFLALPLLCLRHLTRRASPLLGAIEVGLWCLLGVFALRDSDILWRSLVATARNGLLDAASWGVALGVLAVLTVLVWFFAPSTGSIFLRFPLTTFVPFSFIMAYLRDGAYRVNPADSFNRMLFHIVPIAIVYVCSAAVAQDWSPPWRRSDRRPHRIEHLAR